MKFLSSALKSFLELTYCEKNQATCLNGGRCTSLTRDDGYFICECPTGFRGRNCEILPPSMTTTTTTTTSTTTLSANSTIIPPTTTEKLMIVEPAKMTERPILGDDLLSKPDLSAEDINNEAK